MKIVKVNSTYKRRIAIFHFAPPKIDSGGVVDSRKLIESLADKCCSIYELLLFTNDLKLINLLIKSNKHKAFEIYFLPIFENPLYSFKLALRTIISLVQIKNKLKYCLVYISNESPTILLPLLVLLRILKAKVAFKQHSYYFIFDTESIRYIIHTLPKIYQRLLYILLAFIYTNIVKYFKPFVVTPNNYLALFIRKALNINALFIPPGNYPLTLFTSTKPHVASHICSVSSKIDVNYIRVLEVIAQYFSTSVILFGKPYGPQQLQVQQMLTNSRNITYMGLVPRERLLHDLVSTCKQAIYVASYETWAYALYELLATCSTVYVIFPNLNIANSLIELYREIFKDSIKIVYKFPVAIFRLQRFDSEMLLRLQERYVSGFCKLFEVL